MLAEFENFTADIVTNGGTFKDLLTRVHRPKKPSLSALWCAGLRGELGILRG